MREILELSAAWQAVRESVETHVGWLVPPLDAYLRSSFPGDAALTALTLVLILFWRTLYRHRADGAIAADLPGATRRPRLIGYMAGVALVTAFAGWASIANLASAALAPGVVSPDGHRKTIQHLEGGIIQRILVKEGDVVDAGDTLVTLDATQAVARHRELRERYADLLAMEARLVAEQSGGSEMSVPTELKEMTGIETGRAIADQLALWSSRRTAREGREKILRQRILQVEEEMTGFREMIEAQDRQLALLDREMAGVQKLLDKGLESLPRLLALQRAKAQIETDKAGNRARIARGRQQIGETEMQSIALRDSDNERINEDLTKSRGELAELRSQLTSRHDILARTEIVAPISGTVMNVKVTTESGVVGPGDPILDIVPSDGLLIIDAHVKPTDIDNVHSGMKTRVLLTAYRQRNLPEIHGVLRSVSADILFDDASRSGYFLAKVEVDPETLQELDDVRLMPGMPAEVMILSGEQTLLQYIISPLSLSVTRSFREH